MAITELYVSPAGAGAKDGSSEANAYGLAEFVAALAAGVTAGNRYNIVEGTYTLTADLIPTGDGTTVSPVIFRGYKTTIGDLDNLPLNVDGTPDTTDFPVIDVNTRLFNMWGVDFLVFQNLKFTGSNSNYTLLSGGAAAFHNCDIANTGTGYGLRLSTLLSVLVDTKITGSGKPAVQQYSTATCVLKNCTLTSTSDSALVSTSSGTVAIAIDSVLKNSGNYGYDATSQSGTFVAVNTTIYNNADGGIRTGNANAGRVVAIDCAITDNGVSALVNGYVATADKDALLINCRTRDNTALDAGNGFTDWLAGLNIGNVTTDTGGAETDYTDAGNGNFRPIASSPLTGASHTPGRDIGARQSASSGGNWYG